MADSVEKKVVLKLDIGEVQKNLNTLNTEYDKNNTKLQQLIANNKQGTDEFKNLTKEIKNNETQIKQNIQVLATYNNQNKIVGDNQKVLTEQVRQLGAEMKKVDPGTEEYKALFDQYTNVKKVLTDLNRDMGNWHDNVGNYKSAWDGFRLSWSLVATGINQGLELLGKAWEGVKKVYESTAEGADKLKVVLYEASEGTRVFFATIQNGDWSNFLTNIDKAISKAKAYQEEMNFLAKQEQFESLTKSEMRRKAVELEREFKEAVRGEGQDIYGQNVSKNETEIGFLARKIRFALEAKSIYYEIENIEKEHAQETLNANLKLVEVNEVELKQWADKFTKSEDLLKNALEYNKIVDDNASRTVNYNQAEESPEEKKRKEFIKNTTKEEIDAANFLKQFYGKYNPEQIKVVFETYEAKQQIANQAFTNQKRLFTQIANLTNTENKAINREDEKSGEVKLKNNDDVNKELIRQDEVMKSLLEKNIKEETKLNDIGVKEKEKIFKEFELTKKLLYEQSIIEVGNNEDLKFEITKQYLLDEYSYRKNQHLLTKNEELEYQNTLLKLTTDFNNKKAEEQKKADDSAIKEEEKKQEEILKAGKNTAFESARNIIAGIMEMKKIAADRELKITEDRLQSEEDLELSKLDKSNKNQAYYDKLRRDLEYKAAIENWENEKKKILLEGALAAIKVFATAPNWIVGAIEAIAVGIETAIQYSTADKQKPVYAFGGAQAVPFLKKGFVLNGNYHGQGDTTISANGVPIAKAEKDELLTFVNRKNTKLLSQLSAFNQFGGNGVSFFDRGGISIPYYQSGGLNYGQSGIDYNMLADMMAKTKIFVQVKDIIGGVNDYTTVRVNANI